MLQIEDYKEQITNLYLEGKSAIEISRILNFRYHQPVYNFFKKNGWERKGIHTYRKYTLDEDFFKAIDSEEKAYILGFICADGHIDYNRIKIGVSIKDKEILEKIRKALKSNANISSSLRKNPYTKSDNKILTICTLELNSIKLVKPLFKMGLTGNKTYTLNSSILKYVPKYLTRDFLRGYFDGDGNFMFGRRYNSGYKYNVNVCGNEEFLLNTFQKYFPSTNKLYKDLYSRQCYVWKISSKDKIIEFLNYLYYNSSIFLQRKYIEYKKVTWACKTGLIAGNSHSRLPLSRRTISSQSID